MNQAKIFHMMTGLNLDGVSTLLNDMGIRVGRTTYANRCNSSKSDKFLTPAEWETLIEKLSTSPDPAVVETLVNIRSFLEFSAYVIGKVDNVNMELFTAYKETNDVEGELVDSVVEDDNFDWDEYYEEEEKQNDPVDSVVVEDVELDDTDFDDVDDFDEVDLDDTDFDDEVVEEEPEEVIIEDDDFDDSDFDDLEPEVISPKKPPDTIEWDQRTNKDKDIEDVVEDIEEEEETFDDIFDEVEEEVAPVEIESSSDDAWNVLSDTSGVASEQPPSVGDDFEDGGDEFEDEFDSEDYEF